MARAKKRTDLHTDATPEAGTAVADLPAGATDFNPAEFVRPLPAPVQLPADDRAAEREQDAQARDAERATTHAEQHERPKARSTELITDSLAKMRMHSNHANFKVAITFDDGKPSDQVRETLKDAGFKWSQNDTAWEKPTGYETRVRDRIDAERAFEAVAEMRKDEMGVGQQR